MLTELSLTDIKKIVVGTTWDGAGGTKDLLTDGILVLDVKCLSQAARKKLTFHKRRHPIPPARVEGGWVAMTSSLKLKNLSLITLYREEATCPPHTHWAVFGPQTRIPLAVQAPYLRLVIESLQTKYLSSLVWRRVGWSPTVLGFLSGDVPVAFLQGRSSVWKPLLTVPRSKKRRPKMSPQDLIGLWRRTDETSNMGTKPNTTQAAREG